MSSKMQNLEEITKTETFGFSDDFTEFTDTQRWTVFGDAGVTSAVNTSLEGGIMVLACNTTDNNQKGIATTNALYKFRDDCDGEFRALITYAEAATDDANVGVGVSSDFGADILLDDGAGADTNHSGALIYKVDGGTKWVCHSSVGATQTTTTTSATAEPASGVYDELKIRWTAAGDGTALVTFYRNDEQFVDANGVKVAHYVTYSGASTMKAGAVVKAGGGATETIKLDRIQCWSNRP